MKIHLDVTEAHHWESDKREPVRDLMTFEFPDDTSFVLNEPNGFLRIMPNKKNELEAPENYYFNMAYVIAIVP